MLAGGNSIAVTLSLVGLLVSIRLMVLSMDGLSPKTQKGRLGMFRRVMRFAFRGVLPLSLSGLLLVCVFDSGTHAAIEAGQAETLQPPASAEDVTATEAPVTETPVTEAPVAQAPLDEKPLDDESASATSPSPALPSATTETLKSQTTDESQKTDGESSAEQQQSLSAGSSSTTESSTGPKEVTGLPDAETPEERKQRLAEVALQIGPWIRKLLDQDLQQESADDHKTQAAESEDKKIMVFQMPGAIGQTYAVIRLTPGVDAAMSPMKSLIKSGRLDDIANSLSDLMKQSGSVEAAAGTVSETLLPDSAEAAPGDVLDTVQRYPTWYPKPNGGRIIVETEPVLPGEDSTGPLLKALNKALSEHLLAVADQLDPVLGAETRVAKFELDAETAKICIVDSFEREEQFVSDVGGPQPFRKVYALVEFPESIDKVALTEIRSTVQTDRAVGLIIVVALGWMSVCVTGLGVRMWNKGSWLRRGLSLPIFLLVATPILFMSVMVAIRLGRGASTSVPWMENPEPVQIRIEKTA